MKTSYKFPFVALLWLVVSSCLRESDLRRELSSVTGVVVNLGIDITIKNARTTAVEPGGFRVDIFDSENVPVISFSRYMDMPDTIVLDPGDYYVTANSGELLPGCFECPYYHGTSGIFTVNPEEVTTTDLICSLGNCRITVFYSQEVIANFNNYYTVVANADTAITFALNESRSAYFDLSPVTITSYLEYLKPDSTTGQKIVSGSIEEPAAQKHYQVHIDAGLSDPKLALNIAVDETEYTELIYLSDSSGSSGPGGIAYGKILVTEIMYDPVSMADTYGEWFELYNASADSLDLYQLVIKRGTANTHIITDHIILPPESFIALAKTDSVCAIVNQYVYGGSITLPNAGDVLSILNYGTDGTDGTVISSVDYTTGFPGGTGSSISLDPLHFQVDEARVGSNWCLSVSQFSTGDFGTPGAYNDLCN
ncbi:MAG TPA: DUF4493 domain-containing protein [Cyclobacteriaceae bacterium]|nr:DUF4493 domain-containing protein [Cyclobacteriaceae bacterium]